MDTMDHKLKKFELKGINAADRVKNVMLSSTGSYRGLRENEEMVVA